MKDNVKLIRKLLKQAKNTSVQTSVYQIRGYSDSKLFAAGKKLIEEKLIDAEIQVIDDKPYALLISSITEKGEDYLKELMEKRKFKKIVKGTLEKGGEITLEIIFGILENL